MAIGPWDPHAAAIGRLRASDADRDRVVDALKAAYAQGLLSTDELAARTSQALAARTYADLTAASAVLAERPAPPSIHPPARTRVSKKAVAFGTSAIVLSPALVAAFLTFYGGFIILFLVACVGVVRVGRAEAPGPLRAARAAADPRGPEHHRPLLWRYRLVASIDLDRLAKMYDAHRSAHPGPLPSWDDISDQEKNAWRAAVTAQRAPVNHRHRGPFGPGG